MLEVLNKAIKLFEDALEKNCSGVLSLAEESLSGYAVFDELN